MRGGRISAELVDAIGSCFWSCSLWNRVVTPVAVLSRSELLAGADPVFTLACGLRPDLDLTLDLPKTRQNSR